MTSSLGLITCLLVVWLPWSMAYPSGPPVDGSAGSDALCTSMMPNHGTTRQTEGFPYEIVLGGDCYKAGVDIPVLVRVNTSDYTDNTMPRYFKGLFLMAREFNSTNGDVYTSTNQGTFDITSEAGLDTYPCYNKDNSAVGHNVSEEWQCKRFTWRAPATFTDLIIFQATVVRTKMNFWTNIYSKDISYNSNCEPDKNAITCDTNGSDIKHVMTITWICLVLTTLSVI